MKFTSGIAVFTLAMSLGVCQAETEQPAMPAASMSMPDEASLNVSIGGTVLEILLAGQYQYMQLDTGSGMVWIAVMQQPAEKGQHVTCSSATMMANFESKILKRTFDSVYFADNLQIDDVSSGSAESSVPSTSPAAAECGATDSGCEANAAPTLSPTLPPGHPALDVAVAPVADMVKPDGGVTIAELVEQKDKRVGTEVVLRVQVAKMSVGIMDMNWLRVRDTSTDRDLVVSSKATAGINDIVLVRGKLEADVAIGGDHKYDLLIRDAEVTVEAPTVP
jgi:hypothetical protein